MASTSKRSASQQPAIAAAASSGMSPALASARARAPSTSSMAWSQARSDTTALMASVEKVGPNRPPSGGCGKKGRLLVPLQVDVEDQDTALVTSHQRGPDVGVGDGGEDGVDRVRGLLVREVHARHQVLEQAAREDDDLDVRGLRPAVGVRHGPGFEGREMILALGPRP